MYTRDGERETRMKTTPLFEDPSTYGHRPNADVIRRLALGGVLQIFRAAQGWSVEQAAVNASMGHMTMRRVQDGYSVRSKTYASLDKLLGLNPGTIQRALGDDLLMVALIRDTGSADTSEVTSANAADFVETFAKSTLSPAAKQTVQARTSIATSSVNDSFAEALRAVSRVPALQPAPPLAVREPSDLQAAADLIDRLTRRALTPALETAVRALLDAMPDLIQRQHQDTPSDDDSDVRAAAFG